MIRARRQVHGAPRGADWLLARVHSAQGRAAEEGGTNGFGAPDILANDGPRSRATDHPRTASRRVFPALNEGAFEAAIAMFSPVRGFRDMPRLILAFNDPSAHFKRPEMAA